jgi:outer membrane receptor protein involved in Fe transport
MKTTDWVKLLATASLVGIAAPSVAQQETPTAPPVAPADAPPADDEFVADDEEVDVSAPGAGGLEGEEIVVVGRRIPNAIRATPSVVSLLSAADLARTGEGDIAGALARVTGLSVVGGKYVYVRGLGERYSLALLNGLPIPSPEPLKRVVPLDLFPTDILASTLVQKSYSVNFPGEFGGGVINLTTLAVPEESFLNLSGSVGGDTVTTGQLGYTYFGSPTDWTGFDNGTRRLPVPFRAALNSGNLVTVGPDFTLEEMKTITASLNNERTNLIQRNSTIPANMSLGLTAGTAWDIGEDRLGVILAASWSNSWLTRGGERQSVQNVTEVDGQPGLVPDQDFRFLSTENRILVNALAGVGYEFGEHKIRFTNVFIRDALKQARIEDGFDERNLAPDVRINRSVTNWFERQLFSSSLVGEFKFDDLRFDVRGTYAKSSRDAPYERSNDYVFSEEVNDFVNNLRGGGTGRSVAFSTLDDEVWAGAIDVGYRLPTERPVTLSAGYGYSDNRREAVRREFRYLPEEELPIGVIQQRPDFLLSPFNIQAYDITLREQSGAVGVAAYEAGLRIHGGYGQVEAELADGLRIAAGVRYESGRQFVSIIDLFGLGEGNLSTRLKNDYWLPAGTLTWNFAEDMQLRVSASKTIARPQFRELAPQQYTDTDNDRTSFGNEFLVDSELINLEARYEWYLGRDERVQAGAFFKKIDRPIEVIAFSTGTSILTTFANAPEAELWGLEFEAQKFFPISDEGFFADRRIFVNGNYTYTQSNVKVREGDTTVAPGSGGVTSPATLFFTDGEPLTGQSDHLVNLQLGLQRDEKLSEQTILLNYASKRVSQRGPGETPDFVERPGVRLDFVAREEITFGTVPLELKFEVRNILGTEYRESQRLGGTEVLNNRYDVGTSFSLGLTAKF